MIEIRVVQLRLNREGQDQRKNNQHDKADAELLTPRQIQVSHGSRSPNGLWLSGARKSVRCSRGLGDFMLVELQTDSRGSDQMKLPPAPRLHFERTDFRG